MLLLLPLVLGFVFMITAWTYCLRGWLAALMVNKRRRRTVIVWVTMVFVLLCQLPNLVFNSSLFRQQMKSAETASREHGKRGGARRARGSMGWCCRMRSTRRTWCCRQAGSATGR